MWISQNYQEQKTQPELQTHFCSVSEQGAGALVYAIPSS